MKILLINPPIENTIQSNQPKILEEGLDFLPPLGLMYIGGSLLEENNYEVAILDCQVEQLGYNQLKAEIEKRQPDIVGITAMTFTLIDVLMAARAVKSVKPDTKIILGGPHVVIYPTETISFPEVDFLVLGEGEKTVKELLANINEPEKLRTIKGLVFKYNGEIINTGPADPIADLDNLPLPARQLTPFTKYFSVVSTNVPVTTMFTSRGCPYQCLFCDRPLFGKNFRAHSAERVVAEMTKCQEMGIKEIFVYDDTFGVDKQRVLEICRLIKERKIKIAWNIRTRVNTVDEEMLKVLKDAGCQRIHYGVEAGTEKILAVLKKGITLTMVKRAFELTKKIGIETVAYFMLGSPTENREDIMATIKLMKKLNPDYVHVTVTTPFPGTGLYRLALEQKIISHDVWREFVKNPQPNFVPPIWEKDLNREELFGLLKKSYQSFYFRPGLIIKKISQLKSLGELLKKIGGAAKLIKI